MKKFLALVLALVMTMSLVTISAGAEDFTDDASITYEEAVDVMTAIGVVGGYADGSFNPAGSLTRGAAAKIICNMILGPTEAGALATVEAPFADVPADHVFAGYIAYCVSEGIVSGYSDGTFRPAGTLTGYAFWKMLLGALGYDAENEGYVGANYAINVAKRGLNIGLNKGLKGDFAGGKALTREEACLYAFNALTADVVKYDNDSKITVGDITITNSSKATAEAPNGNDYNPNDIDADTANSKLQFCEQYFTKLKKVSGTDDAFGRPASHKWQLDGEDIINVMKTPAVTFTANTKAADVAKALKGYTFHTKIVDENTQVGASYATDIGELSFSASTDKIAEAIAAVTGNGVLVEIYAPSDTKVVNDVVVVNYTVAKVNKITTNKKTGDVTYKIGALTKVDYADDDYYTDTIKVEGEIAVGDYVTYTLENAGKMFVYPVTSFTGTQTATKTATVGANSVQTVTIDGAAYEVAHVSGIPSFANQKSAYNYFVDQYGFLVQTTSTDTASTDYAMIVSLDAKVDTSFGTSTPTLKARVVLADGTVGEYTVALTEGEDSHAGKFWIKNIGANDNYLTLTDKDTVINTALVDLGMADAEDGIIDTKAVYGYTIEDGVITFEALTALPANTVETVDNTVYAASIADVEKVTKYDLNTDKDVLVNADTVFVAYNTAKKTATVYEGLSNLPATVTTGTVAGYAVLKTGTAANLGYASVIFFEVGAALAADETDDLVYVATGHTTKMVDGKDKYFYTAYNADGSTFEVQGNATGLGGFLYAPKADATFTASEKRIHSDNALIIDQAALTVDGDMVLSGSNWYNMTADTDVVFVDSALTEVDANQGIIILVKDTNDVDVIYVVAD